MLDDLDREREEWGHKFARDADDRNVYVKTQRAGDSFYSRKGEILIRVTSRSLERFREKLRRLTKPTWSGKLEDFIQSINQYTVGWIRYSQQANTPRVFERLDRWIRRRLRQMVWKRWKRGPTCYQAPVKLGVPPKRAGLGAMGKSPWHMSKSPVIDEALSKVYWCNLGLKSIQVRYQELRSA